MLEIIAETVADAMAAEAGGATQLDLKSAFEMDGLTPTAGTIEQVCRKVDIDVIVMVRPHRKSFVFPAEDVAVMCQDIRLAKERGAAGFLLGALTRAGEIDAEAVKRFQEAAGDLPLNFHLAWELTKDPVRSLDELIGLGVQSVRTTGTQGLTGKAWEAVSKIKALRNQVEGKLDLFLAGGVNAGNVGLLVKETGVVHAHSGAGVRIPASTAGDVVEEKVWALRQALDKAVAEIK